MTADVHDRIGRLLGGSDPARFDGATAEPAPVPTRVSVLAADPDLASAIAPHERQVAVACSGAHVFVLPEGPWTFAPDPDPGGLGALIVHGLILVRVEVGDRAHAELLGAGDIISPWVQLDGELSVPSSVRSKVVDRVALALLHRDFARRTSRWPEIQAGIVNRLILRSRRLSLQSAINAIPQTQRRLELTLWQLAYRFGRVSSGGLKLHLPIRRDGPRCRT